MGFSVLQISAVRMVWVFFQNYQGAAPLGWNVASNILQHGRSVKINDKCIYTLCEMRTTKNLHSWVHTPETTYSVCITVVEYLEYLYIYICICIYIYIYMLLILVYLLDWLDALIPNSEYSWVDIASALLPFENPAWAESIQTIGTRSTCSLPWWIARLLVGGFIQDNGHEIVFTHLALEWI